MANPDPKISAGFTLIELLIVVSMITVLSGLMIPGFTNYLNNQNIRQAQERLKSDLRTIQNKALTGVGLRTGVEYWGLKINSDNADHYYYFTSSNDDAGACNAAPITERSEKLPGAVVITNGTSATCVFFSFNSGDATVVNAGTGGRTIKVGYAGGNCSGVTINPFGLIYAEDVALCD